MPLIETPPAQKGALLPAFKLPSVQDSQLSSQDFQNSALVVMFICNHCPYVQAIEDRILNLAREMMPKGVDFVAICSNDSTNYPDDAPKALKKRYEEKNYPFPYLVDESQNVAKEFGAVCTPDFFVYKKEDKDFKLFYRGRLDDSWKEPSQVKKEEMKEALENLLKNHPHSEPQNPSMGCSIKWKG